MGGTTRLAKELAVELVDAVIPLDAIAERRRLRRERRDFRREAKIPGTTANKLTKRWAGLDAIDDLRQQSDRRAQRPSDPHEASHTGRNGEDGSERGLLDTPDAARWTPELLDDEF